MNDTYKYACQGFELVHKVDKRITLKQNELLFDILVETVAHMREKFILGQIKNGGSLLEKDLIAEYKDEATDALVYAIAQQFKNTKALKGLP